MPYHGDDYADLVTTTLRELERTTWADIAIDNQRHIAMPQILKKKKVQFGSGYGMQFNVRFYSNNAARNVQLNEIDNPTTADTQKTGNIPWRHSESHMAIEERIVAMNRAPARLVNLLETSRVDMLTDLAELMETNFWSKPTSTTDSITPFGVPYWVVYDSTQSDGFNAGNPSNVPDSKAGGLDSSTYTRWKNWMSTYTAISKVNLIRKWREAAVKTDFRPPVEGSFSNIGGDYGFYTNYTVLGQLEELLEAQNDSLGNDVASKDGLTQFRRIGVNWVPWFDNNSATRATTAGVTDPIYGLNWKVFKPAFLSGEYMKFTNVKPHPLHHRVLTQYVDCTYNFLCNDRRRNFVLSK